MLPSKCHLLVTNKKLVSVIIDGSNGKNKIEVEVRKNTQLCGPYEFIYRVN